MTLITESNYIVNTLKHAFNKHYENDKSSAEI